MTDGLFPGSKLKERYVIERELGRGGIGVVYLARDSRLHGMPVVIKFLLDTAGKNAWLVKKFQQEAEALTRINHPNVVRVIDRDVSENGHPFFVMEFIEGGSLRRAMKPEGMELNYVARLTRQIGHALYAAHRQGVYHRDLKPENIMLQRLAGGEEQIKLIDFGIAKVVDSQAASDTEVAVFAGSYAYIAPEQALSKPISAATDIFALAIIVYEMLTGRRPYATSSPNQFLAVQELLRQQQSHAVTKPISYRADLPEAAQVLLLNALSYEAGRRPQNAQIFADDLSRALTGEIKIERHRAPTEPVLSEVQRPIPGTLPIPDPAPLTETREAVTTRETIAESAISSRVALYAGLAVLILAAVAFAGWRLLSADAISTGTGNPTPVNSPAPLVPERRLEFSISLRRNPARFPNEAAALAPLETVFSAGDRIRLNFSSPQAGHLYVINEAPPSDSATDFVLLFPSPTANNGSSRLAAGQQLRIPERGNGIVFDETRGAEGLWLVWAERPIDSLEALKRWANANDAGEVRDAAQADALKKFLRENSSPPSSLAQDAANSPAALKGRSDVLIRMIQLAHR
jgi:serine/threonine protein kinase